MNVASECGYTPQYTGLETLHRDLAARVSLYSACHATSLAHRSRAARRTSRTFCGARYDVTFPMSDKIEVNGPGRHPLYAWLTDPARGFSGDIQWNFEKFLIGRDGIPRARYPAGTPPEDNGLLQDIAEALAD